MPIYKYKKFKLLSGLLGPNSFIITFESIIIKKKPRKLETIFFTSLKKTRVKKIIFKLKIIEFFIICGQC